MRRRLDGHEVHSPVGVAQKLTQSLTAFIEPERTAFNIDDRTRGANEIVEGPTRLAAMSVD